MSECEMLAKCPFINDTLLNMPAAADSMKKTYCRWNHAKCARYKIAIVLGREEVLADLFPGDFRRAEDILVQHDKK